MTAKRLFHARTKRSLLARLGKRIHGENSRPDEQSAESRRPAVAFGSEPPPIDQASLTGGQHLNFFMNNLPGRAWIKDADRRYSFVNPQMAKASGSLR
jgi:hypothetical protein